MGFRVTDDMMADWTRRGLISAANTPASLPPIDENQAERDFQADVEKFARSRGWLVYHTRDSRKSEKGFPDGICLRDGRQVVFELKVGTNKPTPQQEEWLAAFRAAGAEIFVWKPEHWPEIAKVFD